MKSWQHWYNTWYPGCSFVQQFMCLRHLLKKYQRITIFFHPVYWSSDIHTTHFGLVKALLSCNTISNILNYNICCSYWLQSISLGNTVPYSKEAFNMFDWFQKQLSWRQKSVFSSGCYDPIADDSFLYRVTWKPRVPPDRGGAIDDNDVGDKPRLKPQGHL